MTEPLVVFEEVSKRFGDFVAVRRFNLEIAAGEFVAIMGSSGCGKTTTLRMLAGLEVPSDGEIRLEGQRMNEVRAAARDTPLVWQSLALFPFLNVRRNVEFGLRMRNVDAETRSRRAMDWLGRLQIAELAERNIADLSGGQRQRVALARALVTEPQILLLDEPLSALDANLVVHMQGVLSRLQKDLGITFVYVTHSQSEAFAMADRVVIMSQGRIEQVGTPQQIYNAPATRFVAEFVGANNIVPGSIKGAENGRLLIETPLGAVQALQPGSGDPRPGDAVSVVIGADRISLSGQSRQPQNEIACSVVTEEFVGSVVTIYLEAGDGVEFRVQVQQRDLEALALSEGETVYAAWRPEDVYLLADRG